jgi:hypothetical protein
MHEISAFRSLTKTRRRTGGSGDKRRTGKLAAAAVDFRD